MTTAFVDVTYRGLRVVEKAKLTEGEAGMFLETEAPLPVGTPLMLTGEGGERRARVTGVVEHEAGAAGQAAGMRLAWDNGEAEAAAARLVAAAVIEAPAAAESVEAAAAEAAAVAEAAAEADGGGDSSGDGGSDDEAAGGGNGAPHNGAPGGAAGAKKNKKNKKKR